MTLSLRAEKMAALLLVVVGIITLSSTHAFQSVGRRRHSTIFGRRPTARWMVNFNSDDPFQVLDLDPTADKKVIKRAYKRMALKYHPDMVTTPSSTPEEKKVASDRFAKINWAYERLSGKGTETTTGGSANSGSSRQDSSSSGYTPPHRRSGSYQSSSSTDWRDYIPNYADDDKYDAGGDSFGAIFSDLFAAAGSTAVGGSGGLFRDFVDFLEQNLDGYSPSSSSSSSNSMDAGLQYLLQVGTVQEIADEMDETHLVVEQLTTKLDQISQELRTVQAEVAVTSRFSKKLSLEERAAELEARKRVVERYAQTARQRLLRLQTRYKELLVRDGDGDDARRQTTNDAASRKQQSNSNAQSPSNEDGFGSFGGRSRGSSRRRSRRAESSRQTTSGDDSSTRRSSSSSSSYSSTSGDFVPPHRRTQSSASNDLDDQKRLRQLKVDEEFDKLKRDLGL